MFAHFILPLAVFVLDPAELATPTTAVNPIGTPTPAPIVQVIPIEIGRDSTKKYAFDWNGLDVDGGDFTVPIQKVIFRYTPDIGDPRWVEVDHVVGVGENQVDVKAALVAIPAGIYDVQVRFEDVAGQGSNYSPTLNVRVRVKNPSAPANVRVVGG